MKVGEKNEEIKKGCDELLGAAQTTANAFANFLISAGSASVNVGKAVARFRRVLKESD